MQTIQPTTARPGSRTRRRRRVVAAACVAVALFAGVGVKFWLDHRVPTPDADANRLARYMASPAFAGLPDARKAPYLDAFQRASDRGELTPEQQRDVIGNRSGKDPLRHYFSLPPGEREKFLDDVKDCVSRLKSGEPAPDGSAAMYGMVGQMADLKEANAFLLDFLDGIFSRA